LRLLTFQVSTIPTVPQLDISASLFHSAAYPRIDESEIRRFRTIPPNHLVSRHARGGWHPACFPYERNVVTKPRARNTIDRTKHDEDIAERMVGGARMERVSRHATREPLPTADDRRKPDRSREPRRKR
jgi:hypothetical protein